MIHSYGSVDEHDLPVRTLRSRVAPYGTPQDRLAQARFLLYDLTEVAGQKTLCLDHGLSMLSKYFRTMFEEFYLDFWKILLTSTPPSSFLA